MRLLGAVFPLWVSCFGYSLPVVVLPAFDAFRLSMLCPFGVCSYNLLLSFRRLFVWVVCLFSSCGVACCPFWVSVLALSLLAFVIDLCALCLPWLYGFRFCPFSVCMGFLWFNFELLPVCLGSAFWLSYLPIYAGFLLLVVCFTLPAKNPLKSENMLLFVGIPNNITDFCVFRGFGVVWCNICGVVLPLIW